MPSGLGPPAAGTTLLLTFSFYLAQRGRCHYSRETLEMGSVPYSSPYSRSCPRSKPVGATSLSQGRIEVTVHKAFEQHPTSQKTDGGSDSPNAQTHEKPNVSWSLVDDLERGV